MFTVIFFLICLMALSGFFLDINRAFLVCVCGFRKRVVAIFIALTVLERFLNSSFHWVLMPQMSVHVGNHEK